jgi:hypothetical protein
MAEFCLPSCLLTFLIWGMDPESQWNSIVPPPSLPFQVPGPILQMSEMRPKVTELINSRFSLQMQHATFFYAGWMCVFVL